MLIRLNEIPEEGRSWILNNKTGELNESLRDLISSTPYKAEFSIHPIANGGTFQLTGFIKTHLPEQCSRCGLDFRMDVNETFKNLLMPSLETPRDAKFSKPNHYSDLHNEDGPEAIEYHGQSFNVGEFFHELVVLASTPIPVPPEDSEGNCVECKISLKNHTFNYEEKVAAPVSPFLSLKGIKLNS